MLFPGLCEGNLLLLREALEDSGGVQKFQGFGLQNKGNLDNMGIFDRKKTSSQLCVCFFFCSMFIIGTLRQIPGVLQRCGFERIRPDSDTYMECIPKGVHVWPLLLEVGWTWGTFKGNVQSTWTRTKCVSWIAIKRLRLTTWEQYYFIIIYHSIQRKSWDPAPPGVWWHFAAASAWTLHHLPRFLELWCPCCFPINRHTRPSFFWDICMKLPSKN